MCKGRWHGECRDGGIVLRYHHEYDTAGNISRIQFPDGSWVSYTYDALNQLIKEEHSIGIVGTGVLDGPYTSVEYAYDSRGNLLSKIYSDGTTIAYNVVIGTANSTISAATNVAVDPSTHNITSSVPVIQPTVTTVSIVNRKRQTSNMRIVDGKIIYIDPQIKLSRNRS